MNGSVTCGTPVTLNYNVGASCGGTNMSSEPSYLTASSTPTGDYHETVGATQIDAVPISFCSSAGCPSTDIDGQSRPMGVAFDAGADER
jgi:hypothetical protein